MEQTRQRRLRCLCTAKLMLHTMAVAQKRRTLHVVEGSHELSRVHYQRRHLLALNTLNNLFAASMPLKSYRRTMDLPIIHGGAPHSGRTRPTGCHSDLTEPNSSFVCAGPPDCSVTDHVSLHCSRALTSLTEVLVFTLLLTQ